MKKYYLTEELVQEIRSNAEKPDFEAKNGYIIMYTNFQRKTIDYLPLKLLKGDVRNSQFVSRLGKASMYSDESGLWQILPYKFNEDNENPRSIKKTLMINYFRSLADVSKFLLVTPTDLNLYTISSKRLIKTPLQDVSQIIQNIDFDAFSEKQKQIISEENKKLEELIKEHDNFMNENAGFLIKFDKVCRQECRRSYNVKILTQRYLFQEHKPFIDS